MTILRLLNSLLRTRNAVLINIIANKKGRPFTFVLGAGDVIKGWDVGLVGVKVGSELRLTIPANMGYGSKGEAGIPPNSVLQFDVKCLSIN